MTRKIQLKNEKGEELLLLINNQTIDRIIEAIYPTGASYIDESDAPKGYIQLKKFLK